MSNPFEDSIKEVVAIIVFVLIIVFLASSGLMPSELVNTFTWILAVLGISSFIFLVLWIISILNNR